VVVDYAHTPDALEKALAALRPAVAAGHRLTCVFGCGGDRDAGKRPLMGEVAARLADRVIVTSDNPRGEDPRAIIDQVLAGTARARAEAIADRQVAIFEAVHQAGPGDIVLLAGKGHETYQEIAGVRHPFRDAEVALAALEAQPR
jgi:UDP-N-acetylmuramyl tripeptide synthase